MEKQGFPNSELGLLTNDASLVKIIVVKGTKSHESYAYEKEDGYELATKEIEAYFSGHPGEKSSEHVLVIMPTTLKEGDENGGLTWGPPFFGVGRYCFA